MTRQIVLDTETTGLVPEEGHKIIEIGCIEILDRRLTKNNFHQYINPERNVEAGALAVHGINDAFLKDKPKFSEIAESFLTYIGNSELIIHNAQFDISFLLHEFNQLQKKLRFPVDDLTIIDTLAMARKMYPGQKNNLDALCKRHKIDISQRELHGALLDASLLAEVYLKMTGGQGSLFGDEEFIEEKAVKRLTKKPRNSGKNLKIIYATPDELELHQKYLERVKQKSGTCLWNSD
jgi:DNA polymerase III subunit epsilon